MCHTLSILLRAVNIKDEPRWLSAVSGYVREELPRLHSLREGHILVITPQCHQETMTVASPPDGFCVSGGAQAARCE
jgi:hypothetical protein